MFTKILHFFKLEKTELKLWLITFGILALVYIQFLGQFIWGNHDWMPLLTDATLKSGFIEGRISQYIFPTFLLMGKILPLFNTLLGFIFYTLALVLLYTRYFKFKITKISIIPLVTSALLPYINEIIYFQFIVLSQLTWPLIITFSLLAAKRAGETPHFIINTFLCFCFLFLAIGGYPACSNLFVTATVLWFIENITKKTTVKNFLFQTTPYLLSLCFAFISLYFVYAWLIKNNYMLNDMYNNEYTTLKQLILKILPTLQASIISFFQPLPYFNLTLKCTIFAVFILFTTQHLTSKKSLSECIFHILLIIILLLCLKFSAWLSNVSKDNYFAVQDPVEFMVRTDFYAIPVLVLFCTTQCLNNSSKIIKNFTYILSIILILTSIHTNLSFTKTQILGFKAETQMQTRIVNRIQESPDFNINRFYTVIQKDEYPLRTKYYLPKPYEKYGYYLLKTTFARFWLPHETMTFYTPQFLISSTANISQQDITPKMLRFFQNQTAIWPSENSIYIDNKYAIIITTSKERKMFNEQFSKINRTVP